MRADQLAGGLQWMVEHQGFLVGLIFWACFLVALACGAWLWFLNGARIIAAAYVWRRAWRWWRTRHTGGAGGQSDRYRRTMQSTGWRRRRAQAIRRAGGRCQQCGARGPLDVHHLSYQHLGDERPYELVVLCPPCHQAAHRRKAA